MEGIFSFNRSQGSIILVFKTSLTQCLAAMNKCIFTFWLVYTKDGNCCTKG